MILEIFYPLFVLVLFSILDLRNGGVQVILLWIFVVTGFLLHIFIFNVPFINIVSSVLIATVMVKSNNWGVADGYILFGLTMFLGEFYFMYLYALLFIIVMIHILGTYTEHITKKQNMRFPFIPFMTLAFLYVLPKLIVYNMG